MYHENRHLILKLIVGAIALFLIAVAFMDFTPVPQQINKTVNYVDK